MYGLCGLCWHVIPMHPLNPLHPTLSSVHTRARRLIEGWQLIEPMHHTLLHEWCMYSDVIDMFCVTRILIVNDDESKMGRFNSSVYARIQYIIQINQKLQTLS